MQLLKSAASSRTTISRPWPYEEASRYLEDPTVRWMTVSAKGQYIAEDQRIIRNRLNHSAVVVPFAWYPGKQSSSTSGDSCSG